MAFIEVLCAVSMIIGSPFASALVTVGGESISSGKLFKACEVLSRTSFAAFSRSAPRSNSTVMVLWPVADWEDIDFTPSIPLIFFSKGSVICDSIISALAPV